MVLEDVRRLALGLPETAERRAKDGVASWDVKGKLFVWERPLRRADLQALRASAPAGTVLGASVPDLGAKQSLLADAPEVFFTTPHFDGYAAVLVRLDDIGPGELDELVVEAWLARAPRRLARSYLGS